MNPALVKLAALAAVLLIIHKLRNENKNGTESALDAQLRLDENVVFPH